MERARNTERFRWAGDPERWGGQSSVSAQSTNNPVPVTGAQILRAQTRDLIAVAWDFSATWSIEGLTADDFAQLSLQVTLGTGQVTSTFMWQLATFQAGAALSTQTEGARLAGWSSDFAPTNVPWTGNAVIPAGSTGPIAFSPVVPPGYRLHARAVSIGAETNLATRIGNLYIRDAAATIIGAAISLTEYSTIAPGPLDWLDLPSDTPVITCANPPGAGEQIVVTLSGELVRVGTSGVAATSFPIVACAINAVPILVAYNPVANHVVTAKVTAHCAPRSWVP